jgi:NAD(P)-dependent dehydrogenase (short-subunit alcohol dehydrogenase family)
MANYWVTGASSGIGRELVLELARQGHQIIASSRRTEYLQSLHEIYPENITPHFCDVANDDFMRQPFENLPHHLQPAWLDCVIANAGICEYIDLPEFDIETHRRVADSNYFGLINTCQAALPLLKQARARKPTHQPQIVGVSSMSVFTGFPRAEAYGSAKAAMSYFLQSLRCDLEPDIAVTIVYPGFVRTPMTAINDFPMPFLLDAKDAALRILGGIKKAPLSIAFPWQLNVVLKFAAIFPSIWYKFVIPRLTRQHKKINTASTASVKK